MGPPKEECQEVSFLVQDLELSLFFYLGFCGEKMNGKEYERGTWRIYSFKYSGASWMKSETWLSDPQRERWDQREANHSRSVGSRFNKQGNLSTSLVLGSLSCLMQTNRFLHLSARILKVNIEALTEFSYIYCPEGFNNTLLYPGCILAYGSHYRKCGHYVYSKARAEGKASLITWV